MDFPENWQNAVGEIDQRIKASNEQLMISGLTALKKVFQAHEYEENNDDKKTLSQLVELFFPVLESILQQVQ